MVNDQKFPHIVYQKSKTPKDWGAAHGEQFRDAIGELAQIRRTLLLQRNPKLQNHLSSLSEDQWKATEKFWPSACEELEGICQGSGCSREEITILNNYTDFRDIFIGDEGCSTVFVSRGSSKVLAGQTWDMHASAKNYVCVLSSPEYFDKELQLTVPAQHSFSLVGCLGMCGFNTHGSFIGVNNLNAQRGVAGVIWPALVRRCLVETNLTGMRSVLENTPVTSAHNYLIADKSGAEMWEVFPEKALLQDSVDSTESSEIFHTNHCLREDAQALEAKSAIASTSKDRFALLEKHCPKIDSFDDFYKTLTSHEGFPKSICSHFESGAQDPSTTCGGMIVDLNTLQNKYWRGCPEKDSNYLERTC